MQTSSLLGHAQEAYAAITSRPQPADLLLREFFRARKYLGAKDRRWIADVTYALLRWKLQLDEIAARVPAPFASRPAARRCLEHGARHDLESCPRPRYPRLVVTRRTRGSCRGARRGGDR
jgi:hypothetical protein